MPYPTAELIRAQTEIQRLRDACWEEMKQARIDGDQIGYLVARGCKDGLTKSVAILDRYIDEGLGRSAA